MPISQTLRDALDTARNQFTWTVGETVGASESDPDKPDYKPDWYQAQIGDVVLVRDIYEGTGRMREEDQTYLPMHPAEQKKNYTSRKNKAVLFNAFARTVEAQTGMLHRKNPRLIDEPEAIAEHMENIDLMGRAIGPFARDVTRAAMIDGHTYIHVDYPEVNGEVRTSFDERVAGVRPYWTHVLKQDLINLRWEFVAGEPVITLAVYRESEPVDTGKFGRSDRERYRVLLPGEFQVWERLPDRDELVMVDQGPVSIPQIPLVVCYSNRTGLYESTPPLLDLAYENIGHWQLRSDYRHALELSCFPILFTAGMSDDELKVGPNWSLRATSSEANAQWLEPSGSSLDKVRQELKDIEARMAALGLQMLVRETRAAETAEAKSIDKAESDSALAATAKALEDSLNRALMFHAEFMNVDLGETKIVANTDFRETEISPRLVVVLSDMVQRGQLSLDTMWDLLSENELLPEDFDPELERDRLDEQDISGLEQFIRLQQGLEPDAGSVDDAA